MAGEAIVLALSWAFVGVAVAAGAVYPSPVETPAERVRPFPVAPPSLGHDTSLFTTVDARAVWLSYACLRVMQLGRAMW